MSTEQYRTGLANLVNGSQTVIGASTDWANEVTPPAVFKVDIDGEATYSISTVLTATRLQLSANYAGSTNSGLAYMINRSFTTNQGYWRPQQGDADFADNLSQETIDLIDTDIANILSGTATLSSLKVIGNASIDGKLNLGGSLELETNLWVKGNASIDGTLTNEGDVQFNSDLWVKSNASVDGTLTAGGNAQLDSDLWVKGNASIDGFLHYSKTENASTITWTASLFVPDIPGVTGPVAGYTKTWNNILATYMYQPYWTRT